jgi:hypothetical protein
MVGLVVPLLARLGYSEEDRYDGMPVPAAHGSRATTLVIDFALFNADLEALRNQPLLIVEAKREHRLVKTKEVTAAHNILARFLSRVVGGVFRRGRHGLGGDRSRFTG